MTTATATRTTTEATPLPTGPAFEFFMKHNPHVDQAKVARRWHDGAALFVMGHVSDPDATGSRIVRSQHADDPDRPMDAPDSYTVSVAQVTPRIYHCNCPDFVYRGGASGVCKHVAAVWNALYACCAARKAKNTAALVAELERTHGEEFTRLLEAIASKDGKAARTAAARLAGWPKRERGGRKQETPAATSRPQAA